MQKFLAILAIVGLFACSLIGCGGGELTVPVNPDAPIPLTKEAVDPDPGATGLLTTDDVVINIPDSGLQYIASVTRNNQWLVDGVWVATYSGVNQLADDEHVFQTPNGTTKLVFMPDGWHYGGWRPGEVYSVHLWAVTSGGMLNPRVDWEWSFTVDPNQAAG